MMRFLDWLLGPRCGGCNERVFPRDKALHIVQRHLGGHDVR